MLSGREQAPTIVEAVRLGAADYVVKPDDPEGLGESRSKPRSSRRSRSNRLVTEVARSAPAAERRPGPTRSSVWGDSPAMQHDRARWSSASPTAT